MFVFLPHVSFPLTDPAGLFARLAVRQLFNECGAAVWGTSFIGADTPDLHSRWSILSQDVRDVEVVWSPIHRDALGQLLLEQLQVTTCLFASQIRDAYRVSVSHLDLLVFFFSRSRMYVFLFFSAVAEKRGLLCSPTLAVANAGLGYSRRVIQLAFTRF